MLVDQAMSQVVVKGEEVVKTGRALQALSPHLPDSAPLVTGVRATGEPMVSADGLVHTLALACEVKVQRKRCENRRESVETKVCTSPPTQLLVTKSLTPHRFPPCRRH